jgi:cytochrome c oxidase cbb3-type subunit 4
MSFDINTARIAVTVLSFAAFMAIVWYVASPRNRARFDEAARLPFDEADER